MIEVLLMILWFLSNKQSNNWFAVGLVRGTKVPEATVDVDESEFYKAEDGKTIKAYY